MADVEKAFDTPLTRLLKIKHPVMLAGMNGAAGPELAAAVSNSGGIGTVGAIGWTPKFLRRQLKDLKAALRHPDLPFGVDLALPKVGDGARKTNYDYTKGKLNELIDVVIESGATLFVSAIGTPPRAVVDRLHAAGIPVMNMVGAPRHVKYALKAGADIICCQGTEGGGHTGDVASSILIPKVVDACQGARSEFTGENVIVVAAGGIWDGRGLAASLAYGAAGVWVGTRFVASVESGSPDRHKEGVLRCGFHDTIRSTAVSGRPMRYLKNAYFEEWEEDRKAESRELRAKGVIPLMHDLETGKLDPMKDRETFMPLLMGQVAGAIDSLKTADEIVSDIVIGAEKSLKQCRRYSKL
eukprot:g5935.t1